MSDEIGIAVWDAPEGGRRIKPEGIKLTPPSPGARIYLRTQHDDGTHTDVELSAAPLPRTTTLREDFLRNGWWTDDGRFITAEDMHANTVDAGPDRNELEQ